MCSSRVGPKKRYFQRPFVSCLSIFILVSFVCYNELAADQFNNGRIEQVMCVKFSQIVVGFECLMKFIIDVCFVESLEVIDGSHCFIKSED